MPDPPPRRERRALRARLREALARLEPDVEVVAEDVLGLHARIDLVARDAHGGAVILLAAEPGCDLEGLADALAQAQWLAPRLPDWAQLAPGLRLRPERGVRCLLACDAFDARTLAAAARLGPAGPGLLRLPDPETCPQRLDGQASAGAAGRPAREPVASVFRTGLDPQDL